MNTDSLTMAEIIRIEEKAGKSIRQLFDAEKPTAALVLATAWIVKVRTEPLTTYDEFAKTVTYDEAWGIIIGEVDDEKKE